MTNALPAPALLATNGSESTAPAAKAAVKLRGRSGSELRVVHVSQNTSSYVRPFARRSFVFADEARNLLDEQVEASSAAGASSREFTRSREIPPTKS